MLKRMCDICGAEIQNPYRPVCDIDNPPWVEITCKCYGLSQGGIEEDFWDRRQVCMACYDKNFKPLCNPRLAVYRNGLTLTAVEKEDT